MKIAGKHVAMEKKDGQAAPDDGQILQYDDASGHWVPADMVGANINGVPANGDVLIYDGTDWIPTAAGDIPVSVAGVTATTLNAALLEIFTAIP